MSGGHGHDTHGHGGGSGPNSLGECIFGYTKETTSAATGMTSMFHTVFLGLFGGGNDGGGGHGHGH